MLDFLVLWRLDLWGKWSAHIPAFSSWLGCLLMQHLGYMVYYTGLQSRQRKIQRGISIQGVGKSGMCCGRRHVI
jgi:hypothetical protein